MGELRREFLLQTTSKLKTLQKEFHNTSDDTLSEDFLRRYFRKLHTIKGTGNTFNLFHLAQLAHEIETFLQGVQNQKIIQDSQTNLVFQESFIQLLQMVQKYQLEKETSISIEFLQKLKNFFPNSPELSTNDLQLFHIPQRNLAKLSFQEKDALSLSLQKGKTFYLLKVSFALLNFYETFKSFKELLNENGEVIAVSSDSNKNPNEEVNFQIFFTGEINLQELELLLESFSAQIVYEKNPNLENLPDNVVEMVGNLVSYGEKTAKFLNKSIIFQTSFSQTYISNTQLILLNEVASHLLHNACDHAIETPEEREKIGKTSNGNIKISLINQKNEICFCLEDDGRGIDFEKINQLAKNRGILDPDKTLNENEALNLIFQQGFSTSENISEISGRGVGLDAVKDLVEKANGSIEIQTKLGQGTTFSIYLPQNQS